MATKCQVCGPDGGQALAKYKCPTCYLRYCSVVCFKRHKETPCSKPEAPVRAAASARAPPRRHYHHRGVKRTREEAVESEGDDDDAIPLLTEEMKAALVDSKWLKEALSDSTLQRLLSDIDQDPARSKKLKECKEKFQDLPGFLDRLLLEIGALKYEEGRLVFVA